MPSMAIFTTYDDYRRLKIATTTSRRKGIGVISRVTENTAVGDAIIHRIAG